MRRALEPDEAAALYTMLHGDIARVLPGQQTGTIDTLALLGVEHAARVDRLRLVALGDPDVDVSAALDVIASGLGVPRVHISLSQVVGHGWWGTDFTQALHDAVTTEVSGDRAVITLSGIEAIRVDGGAYSGLSGTARRWGQDLAASVGLVLAGHNVRGDVEARRLMVALTGECPGLPAAPSLGDWVDWGIPHVAARHLATASFIRLVTPCGDDLALALLDALTPEHDAYARLGYRLDVEPASLTYAARMLASEDWGGTAEAVGWLRAAARAGLTQLLAGGAPAGTRYTITPDALVIPRPPRGRWTE